MNLKPFLALAASLSIILTPLVVQFAAEPTNTPPATPGWTPVSTNRVTNVVSILSTTPAICPCCGSPVNSQVRLLRAYNVTYGLVTTNGRPFISEMVDWSSATNWVSTNLIPRTVQPYASPGAWPASVPPLNQNSR